MKRFYSFLLVILIVFSFIFGISFVVAGKEEKCEYNNIACWVNQLQSTIWQNRERAVMRLVSLPPEQMTEEVKTALINLLEKESRKIIPGGGYKGENPDDEEYEYFYSLCISVGKLADPRAIPILLKIGNLDALKPYGETVLDIIILKLEDKSSGQRMNAASVLNDFLTPKEKGYTAEGEARQKIRSALLKATKDENDIVRGRIVTALGNFQDDEVIATLEDIKNNDPFFLIGKNVKTGERGIKRYTVREKAQEALEKIKKAKGE